MDRQKTVQLLFSQTKNAGSIAIFGHRNPDGDCLGSLLGWGTFLESQGKSVHYFVPTQPTDSFDFLPDISKVQVGFIPDNTTHYDLLFFLDTATHDGQLGNLWNENPEYFENHKNKIVIDHHISNTHYGDINIIETQASSTCEIITEILSHRANNIEIDKDIANYLLLGISTDTGHFKRATSHKTFSAAGWLLKQGGDLGYISDNMYRKNSFAQAQFTQHILSRIQKSGNIIFSRYTQEERKTAGLENKFVEHALEIMTGIDHDGVFLLFKGQELEEKPSLRCSRRTKNTTIDVADLASNFNGGGHRAAAGSQIEIENNFQETMERIITQAQKLLLK